jgi:transposase
MRTNYKKRAVFQDRYNIIRDYYLYGATISAKLNNTSRGRVYYWVRKATKKDFHSGQWGGLKHSTFSNNELSQLHKKIICYLKNNSGCKSLKEIQTYISNIYQRDVSKSVISRILQTLGWSWKIPTIFQTHKYRQENIIKYVEYLLEIQKIDITKLKFMDESHIIRSDINQKKVLGLVNQRVYLSQNTLNRSHATIILLLNLNPMDPIYINYLEENNNQWSFLDFIFQAIAFNHLKSGDYLILDNVSIHSGEDSYESLKLLLDTNNIKLRYLSTYSPELNTVS